MAFWDNWFKGLTNWMIEKGLNQRPTSAWVIAVVSVLLAILSTTITRLVSDVDALKDSMQKVNEWNQRRKKAMQTADKKLWLSVKRDEERIKKMQSSMMFKRMKPMLFTTIPFLLIFAILRGAFPSGAVSEVNPVTHYYAWLPFNIGNFPWIGSNPWFGAEEYGNHIFSKVPFSTWYFITAFAFGSIISRIFGVTPSGAAKSKATTVKEKQIKTPVSAAKKQLAKKRTTTKK
ncbi:MAG: hypothetical protein HeimAB125_02420 [Candidatus Heimdallarchaeota archaeon AB_125]|nr:MAG: hypothetical protein HeimAB125_02420 [Candidatus Heimdallarchaeota archaeon AB_125]